MVISFCAMWAIFTQRCRFSPPTNSPLPTGKSNESGQLGYNSCAMRLAASDVSHTIWLPHLPKRPAGGLKCDSSKSLPLMVLDFWYPPSPKRYLPSSTVCKIQSLFKRCHLTSGIFLWSEVFQPTCLMLVYSHDYLIAILVHLGSMPKGIRTCD